MSNLPHNSQTLLICCLISIYSILGWLDPNPVWIGVGIQPDPRLTYPVAEAYSSIGIILGLVVIVCLVITFLLLFKRSGNGAG